MATARETEVHADLPLDNASRIAIYDAMSHALSGGRTDQSVSDAELFARVIGRLRVLVPRELHLAGEQEYVDEKVAACIKAGLIWERFANGERLLGLTGLAPLVRYPDGQLREYSPGLELARERLDRDNARLRQAGFDVRNLVPSSSDDPEGAEFQILLASMREHGFMKQFPVVRYEDDVVVDGRARLRAAAILELEVDYLKYGSDRDRTAARRRDTPLGRVLTALYSNASRLPPSVWESVHENVASVTRRSWEETAADLRLTEEWRQASPAEYSPYFDVKKLRFREQDEAKVQVTADEKVMLRSLLEAAGLSNYKIQDLRGYVPFERARSVHSAGRKAVFARASDLIGGIAAMQSERSTAKRKLDPEWEQIRGWLVANFGTSAEAA